LRREFINLAPELFSAVVLAEGESAHGLCPECGHQHAPQDGARRFCENCGFALTEPCLQCGKDVGVWSRFCGACSQNRQAAIDQRRQRLFVELEQARAARQAGQVHQSMRLLAPLLGEGHPQLSDLAGRAWQLQALSEYTLVEAEQERDRTCEKAQKLADAGQAEDALRTLEGISPELRNDVVQRSLDALRTWLKRRDRKEDRIRQAVSQGRWDGLESQILEYCKQYPATEMMRSWLEQARIHQESAEEDVWEKAQAHASYENLLEYLQRYPDGQHAHEARSRLPALLRKQICRDPAAAELRRYYLFLRDEPLLGQDRRRSLIGMMLNHAVFGWDVCFVLIVLVFVATAAYAYWFRGVWHLAVINCAALLLLMGLAAGLGFLRWALKSPRSTHIDLGPLPLSRYGTSPNEASRRYLSQIIGVGGKGAAFAQVVRYFPDRADSLVLKVGDRVLAHERAYDVWREGSISTIHTGMIQVDLGNKHIFSVPVEDIIPITAQVNPPAPNSLLAREEPERSGAAIPSSGLFALGWAVGLGLVPIAIGLAVLARFHFLPPTKPLAAMVPEFVTKKQPAASTVQPVGRGTSVAFTGRVQPFDPFYPGTVDRSAVHPNITLTAGLRYVIEMRTNQFTPRLRLEDPQGRLLVTGLSPGPGLDASVTFTPQVSGPHRIHAASATGALGEYTIFVTQRDP
jgi:hypothetical protein